MRRRIHVIALLAVALTAMDIHGSHVRAQGQAEPSSQSARVARSSGLYIVQLSDPAAITYAQRVTSTRAARARPAKVDPNDPAVANYAGRLEAQHDELIGRVGGGRKVYSYRYVFNGFAAQLSEVQAERLKTQPGVMSVTKDEERFADTATTPNFIGLDAPGGLWDQLGGIESAGEDVVIGIVDSGIWPENSSFTNRSQGAAGNKHAGYSKLPDWFGRCEAGEQFTVANCNGKIVGARHFNEAWGGDTGLKTARPWEFASPRDYNGHGTHTASTAGGNSDVGLSGPAAIFGHASGVAPRARIAVYKALWSTVDGANASGFTSDLVAAIDQAVADGVDVINYSISGTSTNFLDAAELAFLNAADSGVFVAASAGNDGPTNFTVAHPSPWITTVAAGTHDRTGEGFVQLGGKTTRYTGPSLSTGTTLAPLVDAATAGLPGSDSTSASLCFSAADNGGVPVLDPAKVSGKIVVCDRGVNARVAKSAAVRDAGGIGMILVNVTPASLNADLHYVPSVHLSEVDRAAIKAYAATTGAMARIGKATIVRNVDAPFTASFSSRGPLRAGAGDLLKPDIIAPGQDIVAAVAPPGNEGLSFSVYSGTSMSSPHVAGLGALLTALHPDWTPMMIKSALMTSATDVHDATSTVARIFNQGAGHVRPTGAADPGLVYDSDFFDWLAFLCGTTTGVSPSTCAALSSFGYSLDPSDLNTPSIAIGALAGAQTVTRRVTNVGSGSATYSATTSGLTGFTTTVTPSTLTLAAGETASFTVTIARTTATLNAYNGGYLTWSDGTHTVRIPVVAAPVALSAPTQVSSTGGPISYNVGFGYTGPFTATPRGLVPAVTTDDSVADDPEDEFDPAGAGVTAIPITIAAGTTYARFSLFDANVSPASDLDLYVYFNSQLVGASGSGTSAEEVNLVNPAAGNYTVYVHGFSVAGTANFTLFSWQLGSGDAGNMTVSAPATATLGTSGTVSLTFSGLSSGTKYLGSVLYGGATGMPNPTIVRVDP